MIELQDFFKVRVPEYLKNVGKREKIKIMDSVLNQPEGRRGIVVDFNLSSAGRRINNRIYTPRGQSTYVDSWLDPYPKPIIVTHDRDKDPIGRFVRVEYQPIDEEAMKFFNNVNDFMSVKSAFDSDDPERIYKTLNKYNLLTNRKWPGLGQLAASARITDEQAIERFLDERYITFSAGSHTDRYACGICGSDWGQGDMCEHPPGKIHDEGIGVFITGSFMGDHAAVVNTPANTQSVVRSISFSDSLNLKNREFNDRQDDNTIYITDAKYHIDLPEEKTLDDAAQPQGALPHMLDMLGTLLGQYLLYYQAHWLSQGESYYADHMLFERLYEGVQGEIDGLAEKILGYNGFDAIDIVEVNQIATRKLSKWTTNSDLLKQALNAEEDLQTSFKEHYDALDEMDALPLGLDDFIQALSSSHDTHQYLLQQRASSPPGDTMPKNNDAKETNVEDTSGTKTEALNINKLKAELIAEITSAVTESLKEAKNEDVNGTESNAHEDQEENQENQENEEVLVDWNLLDIALEAIMGDEALSAEKRKELPDSAFCGPDRSFPAHNCAHVTAARRLIGRAKLSDKQKEKVLACVNRKAKEHGCDESEDSGTTTTCECDSIKDDYSNALQQIEDLKKENENLKNRLAQNDSNDAKIENEDKQETVPEVKLVENPSEATSQDASKTLDRFTKQIISRFKEIKDVHGLDAAEDYVNTKIRRGHLSRNFDISNFIEETD